MFKDLDLKRVVIGTIITVILVNVFALFFIKECVPLKHYEKINPVSIEIYYPNDKSISHSYETIEADGQTGIKLKNGMYIFIETDKYNELFSENYYYSGKWIVKQMTLDKKLMICDEITGIMVKEGAIINIVYIDELGKILFIVRMK
jgi:hypothetical protein